MLRVFGLDMMNQLEFPLVESFLNKYLRKYFTDKYGAYFAEPVYSADNAAGTALLAYQRFIYGK